MNNIDVNLWVTQEWKKCQDEEQEEDEGVHETMENCVNMCLNFSINYDVDSSKIIASH